MPANPDVVITSLGGNCPVQAEGTIDGVPFYFRARGTHWSIEIGHGNTAAQVASAEAANPPTDDRMFGRNNDAAKAAMAATRELGCWYYEEHYGEWPAAGWMTEDEAEAFIYAGAARWREHLTMQANA